MAKPRKIIEEIEETGEETEETGEETGEEKDKATAKRSQLIALAKSHCVATRLKPGMRLR